MLGFLAPSKTADRIPARGRYAFRVSIHADERRSCSEDFLLTVLEEGGEAELDTGGGFVAYRPPQIEFDFLPSSLAPVVRPLLSGE